MPDGIGSWYFPLDRQSMFVVVPHRLPIAVFVLLAIAPWIRWSRRFSLLTLLIATTLVAAALGLIVYVAKK